MLYFEQIRVGMPFAIINLRSAMNFIDDKEDATHV
jgi:hypothetical protein